MAQNDIQITTTPPLPGLTLVQGINGALQSLATDFAGPVDPAAIDGVGPYCTWADTGNGLLKRRNAAGTDWIVEGVLFKASLPQFAETDIPLSDKGPIYVVGKGVYEWSGSAYAPASIVANDISVSSLNGGQLAGFRNKIINGAFQINQRTYVSGTATTAGQYTLDRWKVTGTGGITFATVDNKTTVTIPAGQTLQQVIEGLNLQSGDYVLSWEGTAQGRIGTGAYGDSGKVTATIIGGTDTTIEFGEGTVTNAQVEFGEVATPFEHNPYGAELALCQRYYRTSYIGVVPGTVSSVGVVYGGHYYNTSAPPDGVGVIKIDYGVDMRATPTVGIYSPNSGAINNVFDNAERPATVAGNSLRGLYVNYTGNGGQIGQMHYTASAEL